jgi:hypothetical protein
MGVLSTTRKSKRNISSLKTYTRGCWNSILKIVLNVTPGWVFKTMWKMYVVTSFCVIMVIYLKGCCAQFHDFEVDLKPNFPYNKEYDE